MGWTSGDRRSAVRGQASLELALVLPLVLTLLLFLVQLGLVVRDQIMVIHAAREGARAAAVDARLSVARQAALGSADLEPNHATVVLVTRRQTDPPTITVTVTYRSVTDVPLIGPLLGDLTITESTTMRLEE